MTSFSSLARALELKANFNRVSKFKDLTPEIARTIISSKVKNEEMLAMCRDYLSYYEFRVLKETAK